MLTEEQHRQLNDTVGVYYVLLGKWRTNNSPKFVARSAPIQDLLPLYLILIWKKYKARRQCSSHFWWTCISLSRNSNCNFLRKNLLIICLRIIGTQTCDASQKQIGIPDVIKVCDSSQYLVSCSFKNIKTSDNLENL